MKLMKLSHRNTEYVPYFIAVLLKNHKNTFLYIHEMMCEDSIFCGTGINNSLTRNFQMNIAYRYQDWKLTQIIIDFVPFMPIFWKSCDNNLPYVL